MAVDFKLIGSRIKSIRRSKHITQENLAEQLSFSVGYVSNMERGATKISLNTLSMIADALDCDVAEFIQESSLDRKTYLDEEFSELLSKLTNNEKRMAYKMLEMYIGDKSKNSPFSPRS